MSDERAKGAEQLALTLIDGGLQRMAARVLALFLFTERETLTMGEIAERLDISAGSVSGTVKSLLSTGLIERIPAPGSRREHYRMRDNAWAILFTSQNAVTKGLLAAADSSLAAIPEADPAHHRLAQMRDFYQFMLEEIPALIERWQDTQAPHSG
ncbi:GbsR/MarR family transcriptional regulator [Nonomuraea typhae]|uniref:GbsR/MarR family transcriptional regulator n=1 Tax=Nonomuraea typhae TaxID=2603600 RepID=A0ABW7Z7R6_9ACTN